jgi:NAD-dependent dihydropyrimidine dehydrogenase PreA subunit
MAKELLIERNKDTCLGCNECIRVCPQSQPGSANPVIVAAKTLGEPPEVINIDNCIQCMLCHSTCRAMAITFTNHHAVNQIIQDEDLMREVRKII